MPPVGSGSCRSSAASERVASATRRIGRAIDRATMNDSTAAKITPASAASSRSPRNGRHAADFRLAGPHEHQTEARDRAVRVELLLALVRRLAVAALVHVGHERARTPSAAAPGSRTLPETSSFALEVHVLAALLREVVGAARDARRLRTVDLPPRQHRADRERQRKRDRERGQGRPEQPRPEASCRLRQPTPSRRDCLVPGAAERADQSRACRACGGAVRHARRPFAFRPGTPGPRRGRAGGRARRRRRRSP